MINGYMWLTLLKSIQKGLNTPFFIISTGIPFRRLCMLHLSLVCIFNRRDYVVPLSILCAALVLLWGLPSIHELSPLLLWYILRQCCWYFVSMFLVINSSVFSTLLLSNVCIGCHSVDVFRWSAARNSALISCYWFHPKVIEQLPLFELL